MTDHIHQHNSESETVENIRKYNILYNQNLANFAICCTSFFDMFWFNLFGTFSNITLPVAFLYFFIDFPFDSNEVKLNHLFGMLCISSSWNPNNDVNFSDGWHITNGLLKTEISSIFYILKYWIKDDNVFGKILNRQSEFVKNVIITSNDLLFFATFFKFRIYDYYFEVIQYSKGYELMSKYSIMRQILLYIGVYGFYCLNIYWFIILCKIAFKPLIKQLKDANVKIMEKFFLLQSQSFTMIAAMFIYKDVHNKSYLLDIIGLISLSISSFIYYQNLYKYDKYDKYDEFELIESTEPKSYEINIYFLINQLIIHKRGLLCVASALYYTEHQKLILVPLSFHIGVASRIAYLIYNYNKKDITFKKDNFDKTTNFLNITTQATNILDIIMVICLSQSKEPAINLALVTWLFFVISKICPFYKLNKTAVELLLIIQGIYIAKCNLR